MMDVEARATDQWPMVPHRCGPDQALVMLRFKGAARGGREVACAACGSRFVYRKPTASPRGAAGAPPDGPRTHF
jgi:DNA-directed RNA polymerase subunit RPC12/RpoP